MTVESHLHFLVAHTQSLEEVPRESPSWVQTRGQPGGTWEKRPGPFQRAQYLYLPQSLLPAGTICLDTRLLHMAADGGRVAGALLVADAYAKLHGSALQRILGVTVAAQLDERRTLVH